MKNIIALSNIPETGKEIDFNDQDFWLSRIKEYNIPCTISKEIKAKLFVTKQEEGCLIRGQVDGELEFICDRCTEKALHTLSISIDEFAPMPTLYLETVDEDGNVLEALEEEALSIETNLIFEDKKGIFHLDIEALLFEEFSLDLPIKPLCTPDCAGRCLHCGVNKNETHCLCETGKLDPRFEKLHNLKVTRKQ